MSARLRPGQTLLLASLVFGLFFGAGNLIFPAGLGRDAGSAVVPATLGFLLTAVGLPVLGIIASALTRSRSVREMTAPISPWFATAFTCLLYLAIGPLFAIPRTATVSYEIGVAPLAGDGPWLPVFTLVFFGVAAVAAFRPGRLLDWVGRFLTPVFLLLLGALAVAAVVAPMSSGDLPAPAGPYADGALTAGILDGYNTMDALASLAFAVLIVEAAGRLGVDSPRRLAVELGKAGIVGGLGMAVVYGALAYIGATSHGALPGAASGGAVLAGTASHYFGPAGTWLIAAIVLAACLKTSIGLIVACGEMFAEMFPGSYRVWASVFLLVSLVIANLGLEAIIAWSIPVLMFLYPLAIVIIALGLGWGWVRHHLTVARAVVAFTAVAAVFDLLAALPETLAATGPVTALTDLAGRILPWYENGFGWVVPALVGLVVGLVLEAARGRGRSAAVADA
ncbi:branched-chain amino acid transport system II carrier protein [Micrococcus porci]|uniref:branched-chain amino acid transport system II carrier protein n=1 Tax=Micrococcus TaxID=1269 RepID=UPI001CC99AED|nr:MULTISPECIES: branched-chain amino acid transport system II carrier protein [Micrococcus]MCG7422390.1 branched-chain amino acid transport system II carrier protein [Micrococcus sp. ACRRV]UBH24671.1 branched-chain amino acid transport system II carrier protein [Micrococcus porci]